MNTNNRFGAKRGALLAAFCAASIGTTAPPARAQNTAPVAVAPGAPAATASTLAGRIGTSAPAFALPDQDDVVRRLNDARGKWVVLAFYPADMTRGCTLQNKSYSDAADKFAPRNAEVYTVSTQDVASKKSFCAKEGLRHRLLSDVGGKTAQAYGVLRGPVARRVTFYIAPGGTIAAVDENIRVASAAEDSLARLAALQQSAPVAARPRAQRFAGPADTLVTINAFVADFGLPDARTGKTVALSTLRAGKKATVLVFVSTECPVSNAYNARLAALAHKYGPQNVAMAGINANAGETAAQIADHGNKNGLAFPLLKDAGNKIADRFAATRTPEVYVLDKGGVLVYHGAIDDAQNPAGVTARYVESALDALLAGNPVPTKTSKVFGSEIKRAAAAAAATSAK